MSDAADVVRDYKLKRMQNTVLDNFKLVRQKFRALPELQRANLAVDVAKEFGGSAVDVLGQLVALISESGNMQPLKNSELLFKGKCAELLLDKLKLVRIAEERQDSVYVAIDDDGNVQYVGQSIDDSDRNKSAKKMGVEYLRLELDPDRCKLTLNQFEAAVRIFTQWALVDPCRDAQNAFVNRGDTDRQHCKIEDTSAYNWAAKEFGGRAGAIRDKNGLNGRLTLQHVAEIFQSEGIKAFIDEEEVSVST